MYLELSKEGLSVTDKEGRLGRACVYAYDIFGPICVTIQSVVQGNNADLIAEVAKLYATGNPKIADLTYGKGCVLAEDS